MNGVSRGNQSGKVPKGCLIAAGVVGVVGLLAAGGCFFLVRQSLKVMAEQVSKDLADNPVLIEHVGEIESFEFSITKTSRKGTGRLVFEVTGSKGSGLVIATVDQGGDDGTIGAGTLEMSSGETFDLFPEEAGPEETGPEETGPDESGAEEGESGEEAAEPEKEAAGAGTDGG